MILSMWLLQSNIYVQSNKEWEREKKERKEKRKKDLKLNGYIHKFSILIIIPWKQGLINYFETLQQ